MAVQQNRKTRSRRGMRRSHDSLTNATLSVDQTTGETHRRHQTGKLEVRQAKDAVAAGASIREASAEADEQAADEHPGEFARMPEADHLIEQSQSPDGRPSATKHRRQESADREAGNEGHAPFARGAHCLAREVRDGQHEAADIFKSRGDAEAAVGEEEQRQRYQGDASARNRPVNRRQVMKNQRHWSPGPP